MSLRRSIVRIRRRYDGEQIEHSPIPELLLAWFFKPHSRLRCLVGNTELPDAASSTGLMRGHVRHISAPKHGHSLHHTPDTPPPWLIGRRSNFWVLISICLGESGSKSTNITATSAEPRGFPFLFFFAPRSASLPLRPTHLS